MSNHMQRTNVQSHATYQCPITCNVPMSNHMQRTNVQSHATYQCPITCNVPMSNHMQRTSVEGTCTRTSVEGSTIAPFKQKPETFRGYHVAHIPHVPISLTWLTQGNVPLAAASLSSSVPVEKGQDYQEGHLFFFFFSSYVPVHLKLVPISYTQALPSVRPSVKEHRSTSFFRRGRGGGGGGNAYQKRNKVAELRIMK